LIKVNAQNLTAIPNHPAMRMESQMAYKTIMVCLNEVDRIERLLDFAIEIADDQNAHILGLYVIPAVQIYPSVTIDVSPQIFESYRNFFKRHAQRVRESFESRMRRSGLPLEWCLVHGETPLVADTVIEHGMAADLIVASQVDRADSFGVELDFIERRVMGLGRPLLLVPTAGRFGTLRGKALIGWNGTREAARAAFDAIPLLQQAEAVTITWVDPQRTLEASRIVPCAELATALTRHGITTTAEGFPTAGLTAGEALKMRALDLGADLLVMGAYGHTRISEFVFGGATAFMLKHAPIPILMSH
jgi:nucleotide-binding universal stress UspA family protein